MPCARQMLGCRVDCSHRRFVLDYVAERDAQEVRAENATGGYATELADYYRDVEPRLTFASHLKHHTGDGYPYPRHDQKEAA